MMERIPPQNIDAEMATLGSILLDGQPALDRAIEIITEIDFYREIHRLIFKTIVKLSSERKNIDMITLIEELGNNKDKVGGFQYVTSLVNSVPSSANLEHYAQIVKDKSLARQKIQKNNEVNEKLYSGESSIDVITESMLADMTIVNTGKSNQIVKIGPEVSKIFNSLDTQKENNGITGISTGFPEIDRICGGLQAPSYNILAARPSMGKTTFAMNIGKNAAQDQQIPVLMFSLEMSRERLARKYLSLGAGVNSKLFHNANQITGEQWSKITYAMNKSSDSEFYIDDSCNLKASEVWVRSRKFKTANPGLGLIIIDYLQLLAAEHPKMAPIERVSEASRIIFNIGKELNVPVIALSQLSRSVEQRENKIPLLSDLRESGSLEQDADTVIFLYRPDYYNDDKSAPDPSETGIIFAKNRLEGGIGAAKLKYYKAQQKFMSY